MSISILGAGSFGTALAISLARGGRDVTLWARDGAQAEAMQKARENTKRLAGCTFPDRLSITADLTSASTAQTLLLAVPMQQLAGFAAQHKTLLSGKTLVACCKGIDVETGRGPVQILDSNIPESWNTILTGPSFASDIAKGLPTALTLAVDDEIRGKALQSQLSTDNLRLYLSLDPRGAELGGALKNVIAIASGAAIGAGLGESARAAIMTRGFAEMQRLALAVGARPETLFGLSGFGDLTLTCTSTQSRNYRYGFALGSGAGFDENTTVEGVATAKAVSNLAQNLKIDMPITAAINRVLTGKTGLADEMNTLLSRPLKKE